MVTPQNRETPTSTPPNHSSVDHATMNSKLRRRTNRQLRSRPKLYQDDTAGVVILVAPSATGKGIHKRWKYSDSSLNIRKIIPAEKKSAVRPLMRELTVHIDGAFAHMFNRSLSASEQLPPAGDTVNVSTLSPESDTGSPVKSEDDEMHSTQRESACDQDIPSHIVLNPEELDTEAVMRRMIEQEERIEETFQVQWQKMLDQRQAALRSIRAWARRGNGKNSVRRKTKATARNSSPQSGANRQRGESKKRKPRGRPLGPCGTVIIDIDDEYKRGQRTSPPPVYPPEWVVRKLARRESTESIEELV